GMPEASGYAGWGRLGSANGMPVSAKKCPFAPDFRRFGGFTPIWRDQGAVIRELGNWFDPHPVDVILPLAGRPRRACGWHIAYGKPRPRARPGLPNRTSAAGSVADVRRAPAEAKRRQHAAGRVAAVIAATADEADAEAGAPVMVVMVMRPDEAARRSGGRRQRHGAEGSGGDKSESHFAKHGRSP